MNIQESIKETVTDSCTFIPKDGQTLEEIIKSAKFPEDYDAFDDELLDMIP